MAACSRQDQICKLGLLTHDPGPVQQRPVARPSTLRTISSSQAVTLPQSPSLSSKCTTPATTPHRNTSLSEALGDFAQDKENKPNVDVLAGDSPVSQCKVDFSTQVIQPIECNFSPFSSEDIYTTRPVARNVTAHVHNNNASKTQQTTNNALDACQDGENVENNITSEHHQPQQTLRKVHSYDEKNTKSQSAHSLSQKDHNNNTATEPYHPLQNHTTQKFQLISKSQVAIDIEDNAPSTPRIGKSSSQQFHTLPRTPHRKYSRTKELTPKSSRAASRSPFDAKVVYYRKDNKLEGRHVTSIVSIGRTFPENSGLLVSKHVSRSSLLTHSRHSSCESQNIVIGQMFSGTPTDRSTLSGSHQVIFQPKEYGDAKHRKTCMIFGCLMVVIITAIVTVMKLLSAH